MHSHSANLAAHADAEALVLGRAAQLANVRILFNSPLLNFILLQGQNLHLGSPSLAAHADAEALVLGRQAQLANIGSVAVSF